jgi:hypothetical protein
MKRKTLVISVCLVLAALLALVPSGVIAQEKSPTIVYFDPAGQTIFSGATTTVEVWIQNASNFYGAQFEFQFNPAFLDGITVTEGAAFTGVGAGNYWVTQKDFAVNRARFAASLVGVPALNGDLHIATIEYRGRNAGYSPLTWINVVLANDVGAAIPHIRRNGGISVTDLLDIVGYAFMQGRQDHTGIDVEVSGPIIADVQTDANGRYAVIDARAGGYQLLFEHDLYLATHLMNCNTGAGTEFNPPPVTLVAGDLNNDQAINIMDLTRCAAAFGTVDAGADLNADGIVDLLDLVLIGINFGKVGPTMAFCP